MKVNVTKRGEYIPEWNGNRTLTGNDRVTIDYKNLTRSERMKHIKTSPAKIVVRDAGKKSEDQISEEAIDKIDSSSDMELVFDTDEEGMLKDMDIKISNLETSDGKISNLIELNNAPDPDHIFEKLIDEIKNKLLRGQKGVSEQVSKNLK